MVGWTYEDKMFFSNMAEIEEEFYKFNDAIAEGSGDLKQQIGKLFETLRKVKYSFFLQTFLWKS